MRESWLQMPSESGEAYQAFRRFLDLGTTRTLAAAYRAHVEAHKGPAKGPLAVPGSWKRWAAQHNWRGRAEAHDGQMQAAEVRGRESAFESAGADWAKRQQMLREREWLLSQAMLDRALTAMGNDRVQTDDGEEPMRPGDAARLAEVGSRLGRLSSGLVTDRQSVTKLPKPVAEMTDAELEEWAASEPTRATRH